MASFLSGVVAVLSPLRLLSLVIFTLQLHKQLRIIEAEWLFNKKESALLNFTGSKAENMDLILSGHSYRTLAITLCCFLLRQDVPALRTYTHNFEYMFGTVEECIAEKDKFAASL